MRVCGLLNYHRQKQDSYFNIYDTYKSPYAYLTKGNKWKDLQFTFTNIKAKTFSKTGFYECKAYRRVFPIENYKQSFHKPILLINILMKLNMHLNRFERN